MRCVRGKLIILSHTPRRFFNSYSMKTHSRAGSKAPLTVTLEAGLLNQFTFSQEPYLRKLGLNTQLAQVRLTVCGGLY